MSPAQKKWLSTFLLLLTLWLALVALFAGQFIIAASLEWNEALVRSVEFWLVWLPLLPLTVWLARRFPLDRARPVLSIAVHLMACAVVVFACQAFAPGRPPAARERETGGPPPRNGGGPPPWGRGPREGPPPRDEGPVPRRGPPPRDDVRPGRPRGLFGPQAFRGMLDVLVYGGVVSLTHAIALLRRSRQRERRALELEASLSRARLDALRLQINPHFLFNTLNAIASLIHTRPEAADEMIGSLSELLRATLQGAGHHEVPLSQEMEMLRLFMDIERTRFGDRIRFVEDIDPATLKAMVPSLALQPLVENAVRHGLEPRVEHGTVTVRARRDGERLILSVGDDGAGFSSDQDRDGRQGPGGIGLANTRDRLRALYGEEQSLTIERGASGGTVVSINIPFHTASA